MNDSDAVIRLAQVSLVRGGTKVLSDVSWHVGPGERWVVLGPNGAGKTSLLQLLAAECLPTRGAVSILGATLGRVDLRDLRTRIGYTSVALLARSRPQVSAAGFVVAARYGQVLPWRQPYTGADWERARHLLAELGCGAVADRPLATLSEGERQRASIARALMNDPELLVLDEPTSGLDLGGREQLVAALDHLSRAAARSVVLVIHRVEEIPSTFTHALLLREGTVLAAGPLVVTLTSAEVSACFRVPLVVEHRDGRFTARGAR